VDVPGRMFSVDEEHSDDNSVEAAYLRHVGLRSSSFSLPNVKRSPRLGAARAIARGCSKASGLRISWALSQGNASRPMLPRPGKVLQVRPEPVPPA
jgi:hypothetical protein